MMLVLVEIELILAGLLSQNSCEIKSFSQLWELFRYRQVQGLILSSSLNKINSCLRDRQIQKQVINEVIEDIQKVLEICPLEEKIIAEARSLNLTDFDVALMVACASWMNLDAIVAQNPQKFPQAVFPIYSVETLLTVTQLEKTLLLSCANEEVISKNVQDRESNFSVIDLSQWSNNIFEQDWQTIEEVLEITNEPRFRSIPNNSLAPVKRVKRAKLIDLGMQLHKTKVALIVSVLQENSRETNVKLQVIPTENICLPPNLEVVIYDEEKEAIIKAKSRETDNWIQIEFLGETGTQFSIELILELAIFSEYFCL
ncbi:MAG: DUF1822 family protein [Kamptonema sp. SIO1D9]|nr:DUF1822 family protein [Kamptonema sp. SIO1D9]